MWAVEVSDGVGGVGVCEPVEDWDVRLVGQGLG